MRKFTFVFIAVLGAIILIGCPSSATPDGTVLEPVIYTVTYNGNTNTSGTEPIDSNTYEEGAIVTILNNSGSLVKLVGVVDSSVSFDISLLFTGWNTEADGSGTDYAASSGLSMGNTNVTLYAQWSAIRATRPGGGLIFYDKGSYSDGWQYLEAAPSDQTTEDGIPWWNGSYTTTGATAVAIGTGDANTLAICQSQLDGSYAAMLCFELASVGMRDDWFLPSMEELNLMYVNLHYEGVGNFTYKEYWTSSEWSDDNRYAMAQDFINSGQTWSAKSGSRRVRAIRAF